MTALLIVGLTIAAGLLAVALLNRDVKSKPPRTGLPLYDQCARRLRFVADEPHRPKPGGRG